MRDTGQKIFFRFKFHYVSINSALAELSIYLACYPLNSIMFLLIRITSYYNICILLPLNSIMFLLIPSGDTVNDNVSVFFKFHYVSINSNFLMLLCWFPS